jgi:hypothetical protein
MKGWKNEKIYVCNYFRIINISEHYFPTKKADLNDQYITILVH